MIRKLKKLFPEKLKLKLKLLLISSNNQYWLQQIDKTKKNIFVFLAGFYQNLGDMAITYSQTTFLQKLYPNANIVAISSNKTYEAIKTIRRFVKSDDIITIIGGGNMDDIYTSLEQVRLYVVKSFPNNHIVSFPQTMSFSETKNGIKKRNKSHKIYANHKNLILFVREPNSLARVKTHFGDLDIGYCPDIVLSLNKVKPISTRTDVICCLRSDKEQNLSNCEKDSIINAITLAFPKAQFTDTVDVALEDCSPECYEQTLENFWNKLRKSRVIITDRLHCMIFCAITGTPCVVFDNSNKKISGVYTQWLNDIPYIKLFSKDQITTAILKAQELYNTDFNIESFDISDKFTELKNALSKQSDKG